MSVSAGAEGPSSFLAGVAVSFVLKLTTSVDDLVWFSPFLALSSSTGERVKYCAVYAAVCVLVAVAALLLARAAELGFDAAAGAIGGGGDGEDENGERRGFWNASTALSLIASAAIGGYAAIELRGWLREGNELPSLLDIHRRLRTCLSCISPSLGLFRGDGESDANDENGGGVEGIESHEILYSQMSVELTEVKEAVDDPGQAKMKQQCPSSGPYRDEAVRVSNDYPPSNDVTGSPANPSDDAAAPAGCCSSPPREKSSAEIRLGDSERGAIDNDDQASDDEEDEEVRATIRKASESTFALFTVALCGTIDDMILFAAVVAGRGIPWTSVVPGSMLAACVVIGVCWRISLYEPFANFVRRVPMWVLLGAIAMYLFVGAFF